MWVCWLPAVFRTCQQQQRPEQKSSRNLIAEKYLLDLEASAPRWSTVASSKCCGKKLLFGYFYPQAGFISGSSRWYHSQKLGPSSNNYILFWFILHFYSWHWQKYQLLGALPERVRSTVIATNGTKAVTARKGNCWPKNKEQEPSNPTLTWQGKVRDNGGTHGSETVESALFTSNVCMKNRAARGGAVPRQSSLKTGSGSSLKPGTVTPVEQWATLGLDYRIFPV